MKTDKLATNPMTATLNYNTNMYPSTNIKFKPFTIVNSNIIIRSMISSNIHNVMIN